MFVMFCVYNFMNWEIHYMDGAFILVEFNKIKRVLHTLNITAYNWLLYVVELLYIVEYSLDIVNICRIGKSRPLVGCIWEE